MWGRWIFHENISPERLEFVYSFANEGARTILRRSTRLGRWKNIRQ